jgi:DNA-binding response OmpR family regulator
MSKRILIIDDDLAIRKSFVLALEDTGFLVDTAESGEKGIEMQARDSYQLIFLDLKMPGMNGVETLRKIRANDTEIPVYIITAFHNEFLGELREVQTDGIVFELLRKPLDSAQIVKVTEDILGSGEAS